MTTVGPLTVLAQPATHALPVVVVRRAEPLAQVGTSPGWDQRLAPDTDRALLGRSG